MKALGLLGIALLTSTAASAAGRSAGEVCGQAGFRPGTPGFTACAMRVEADDPMSGLDELKAEIAPPDDPPQAKAQADEPRVAAELKVPLASPPKRPPIQGNIVINGEVISTQAAPPPMVNGPPTAAPPPAATPSGFPPLVTPVMPVVSMPGWSWMGGGGMQ